MVPAGGLDSRRTMRAQNLRWNFRASRFFEGKKEARVNTTHDAGAFLSFLPRPFCAILPAGAPRRRFKSPIKSKKRTPSQKDEVLFWCRRWDLNPHGLPQRILSPSRLPFHHAGEYSNSIHELPQKSKPFCKKFPAEHEKTPLQRGRGAETIR